MRWLPDSTPISVLSVPGTHDTMSFYGGPIAETQTLPLPEQLKAGIRTIDIRARHIDDRLAIHHGSVFQNAMFGDVLIACNAFLQQNPTETILLWLSDAGVPAAENVTRGYWDTFRWYRDESGLGGKIYNPNASISDRSLGTIRGKIVLISGLVRNDGGCFRCGLNADEIVQNEFGGPATAFEMDEKWAGILLHSMVIDWGSPGTIYENSLTGSTGGVYPIDLANGLLGYEGMAYRYLRHIFGGGVQRTTGLLYMDFPGSGLIGGILAHNMKLATNVSALASDFAKVFNDISYSATQDGIDGAMDRATQLRTFLQNILPQQHWSVLVSGSAGDANWGIAHESDGLFAKSDSIDGFVHVAISSRQVESALTNINLAGYWNSGTLVPLSGDSATRARSALNLLKAQFPEARWNVAVKRFPIDQSSWAADIEAAVQTTVNVADEGWIYSYTAWANSTTNRPPVAHSGGPYEMDEGSPITFDAGQSTDPAGDVLQYRWDLDGNGTWDTEYSFEPTITTTYMDDSAPSPSVQVFDGASASSSKVSLNVRNVAPTIAVDGHITLGADRRMTREFTIADPGSDSWTVNILYGDGTPRIATNLTTRTFVLDHTFPAAGYFQLELDVRDDDDGRTMHHFYVVTDFPSLNIEPVSLLAAEVNWSNHPAPFRLETADNLVNPLWQTVPGLPLVEGSRKRMQVHTTNSHQVFRLALP